MGGHAYGVLSAQTVKDADGNEVQLVKLRNPWGNFEWKGAWGDNSEEWTDELKKELDLNPDADDGTFWMSFDDFKGYFESVGIAKISTNFVFSDMCVDLSECWHSVIDFTVPESGNHTLSVS